MTDAMEGAHRRASLLEVMSAVDGAKNSLAGLSLEAVLNSTHRSQIQLSPARPSTSKTLLDIINGEAPNRDRRTWKQLREMLRLKRASVAWISTVPIPPSNILIGNGRVSSGPHVPISDQLVDSRRSFVNPLDPEEADQAGAARRSEDGRRRLLGEALAEERQLSAREAVAAQEAAETEAETARARASDAHAAIQEENRPVSMSLMELMGGEGDEDLGDEEGGEAEVRDVATATATATATAVEEEEIDGGGIEHTCCVCMVRHKGAAFIPCGHTFCRVCSKELFAQRGTCPICNNFIVEVLEIF